MMESWFTFAHRPANPDGQLDGGLVQTGVLYGDPSPEILQDSTTADCALIDWGTPTSGPLLFDLLTWERFFADTAARHSAGGEVRAGYLDVCPDRAVELQAVPAMADLIDAIRTTWIAA